MIKPLLYDRAGYVVGEPEIPGESAPQVLIWGNEVYTLVDVGMTDSRPKYAQASVYVITDTRETRRLTFVDCD